METLHSKNRENELIKLEAKILDRAWEIFREEYATAIKPNVGNAHKAVEKAVDEKLKEGFFTKEDFLYNAIIMEITRCLTEGETTSKTRSGCADFINDTFE